MRILKLLILFFISFAIFAKAQDVTSKLKLDTNNVLIGERVIIDLEVKSAKGYHIIWPQFADTLGKLEIIKRHNIDTLLKDNNILLSQKLEITSFDSGTFVLEPFTFVYEKSGTSNLLTTSTEPFSITFNTINVDTSASIKDIKSPIEFPMTFDEIVPYIIYTLIAIAIIIIAVVLFKRYKNKPKEEIIRYDASIPADLEAIEALKNLENQKLWQSSHYKEYYTKLTDILRTFVHRRYQVNSFEMTSDEIMRELESKEVPLDAFNMLKGIFQLADLAKFAKMEPIANDNTNSLENAYKFINITKEMIEKIELNNIGDIK